MTEHGWIDEECLDDFKSNVVMVEKSTRSELRNQFKDLDERLFHQVVEVEVPQTWS